MDSSVVGDFILACREAKQIVSLQPQLPEGIGPRDLRILDTVAKLSQDGASVRVSDVSAYLNVSRPNVTRDMGRLADAGLVGKTPSEKDHRTVFVSLTPKGAAVNRKYVVRYHEHLASVLEPVGRERLEEAARTIREVHAIMAADQEAAARAIELEPEGVEAGDAVGEAGCERADAPYGDAGRGSGLGHGPRTASGEGGDAAC